MKSFPPEKPLSVLVIAEAANPEWTSVPLLGWSHAYALSKTCNTHLATQIRNKEAIERTGWKEGKEFSAIDSEGLAAPFHKIALWLRGGDNLGWTISTALNSLVYPYFEYLCWKRFKDELKSGRYDIVHRITPVSPTAPSYLAKKLRKIGIPLVVGPLNGGVPWPKQFLALQHKEKEWLNNVRGLYKFMPGYASLRKHSNAILVGSMATKEQVPKRYQEKTLYLPENAVDSTRFSLRNNSKYELPIKAVFVGRLVPYKGADIAIEAMRELLLNGKIEFDIYGTGPEESRLKEICTSIGVDKSVRVHGFIPNDTLQTKFVKGDILVFPSVREFGGGVVLEAMALGVVPVIVDYAGPSELVTKETGFSIPIGDRNQIVEKLKSTLTNICDKPELLSSMRKKSIDRVQQYYTWERKVEQDMQIYKWVLEKGPKPNFHQPFP